ncbi:MAG: multicopper oxidase domain-containing protein [Bacillota bacterium]|nr:multicopper oxidase domain-containing protein [Bacillota bacterium]
MQFTVVDSQPLRPPHLPPVLNTIVPLTCSDKKWITRRDKKRTLVLFEVNGPNGPLEVLLDGQKWSAPISELPLVSSTEEWEIVNLTMDAHPIHLHLVQFQIESRQDLLDTEYMNDWLALNGQPPLNQPTKVLPVKPYLLDGPVSPPAHENGWKDTVQAMPGQVTTIRVRFAPQDARHPVPGLNLYPFDPAKGPGYVWHCHILDHEDNEMMRPYKVRVPLSSFFRV